MIPCGYIKQTLYIYTFNDMYTSTKSGLLALSVLSWSVSPAAGDVRRPPNYHHMPDTSFTCAGKVVGGYYADPDADCQMFHVCVQVDENDVSTPPTRFAQYH